MGGQHRIDGIGIDGIDVLPLRRRLPWLG